MVALRRISSAAEWRLKRPPDPLRPSPEISVMRTSTTSLQRRLSDSGTRLILVDRKTACRTPKIAMCSICKDLLKFDSLHLAGGAGEGILIRKFFRRGSAFTMKPHRAQRTREREHRIRAVRTEQRPPQRIIRRKETEAMLPLQVGTVRQIVSTRIPTKWGPVFRVLGFERDVSNGSRKVEFGSRDRSWRPNRPRSVAAHTFAVLHRRGAGVSTLRLPGSVGHRHGSNRR